MWIACCEWTQSLSAECTFCGPVIMLMLCVKAPLFTYISTDFDCTQSTVFCMTFLRGSRLPTYPHFVCVVLALPFLSGHPSGYGLVQEELLSPASMQYSLPSPLGIEPYWQEVSSLESAPIATTEEDTLMEMSDVQVWPAGVSPSLVTVEDSSLDGSSRADDSEANTLSLPCSSLGRPSSGASGASGSIMELEEEEEEEEIEEDDIQHEPVSASAEKAWASGAVPKANYNGQAGGQRSEGKRTEVAAAAGGSLTGVARGGGKGGKGASSEEKFSVLTGQQLYAQLCERTGLTRALEHNGDRYRLHSHVIVVVWTSLFSQN